MSIEFIFNSRRVFLLLLLVCLPSVSSTNELKDAETQCQMDNDALRSMAPAQLVFARTDETTLTVDVIVADTLFTKSQGFQRVCSERIAETPILFVFAPPQTPSFHMNNVVAAIDIAFIDRHGRIESIQSMLPYQADAKRKRTYSPRRKIALALEARPGFFEDNHIGLSTRVSFLPSVK